MVRIISGIIVYRITQLKRKEIGDERKSTIRIFNPLTIWTENEFIENVLSGKLVSDLHTIDELWSKDFSAMIIEDSKTEKLIKLIGRKDGTMYIDFQYGVLRYKYVDAKWKEINNKDYCLSNAERNKKKWRLIKAYNRK